MELKIGAFESEKQKIKQKELEVFTRAKKLCEYVYTITKKAPKEYRWNIIDKMLNCTLLVVELLYSANDATGEVRREKQREIDTKLKFIGWLGILADKNKVISPHQTEYLGELILETRRDLWRWIKGSDSS